MKFTLATALVLLVVAGTPSTCRNKFPQFPAVRVSVDNLDRDIAAFDQAAAEAGFVIKPNDYTYTYDSQQRTSVRLYETGVRCCFTMSLSRWHEEAVLEIWVRDHGRDERPFDPADCAMYERFRASIGAKFKRDRIFYENAVCAEGLPLN